MIRVGLNGAGRIGRAFIRATLATSGSVEIVAVNDVVPAEAVAYLLRHDSVHDATDAEALGDAALRVGGTTVAYSTIAQPGAIPWDAHGVDLVVEATGRIVADGEARAHLRHAPRVLVTAPMRDADQTIVFGVNDVELESGEGVVISGGSCTTNCLAPISAALSGRFGWDAGLVSTVHSYTADQALVDRAHPDLRRGRSAATNIVPTTTGAAVAVARVLPELEGRFDGRSLRVPVPDVSLADIAIVLGRAARADEVNAELERAAATTTVLSVTHEPVVSSDIVGNRASAVVDAALTQSVGPLVKVFAWYDNETGYAHRLLDIAQAINERKAGNDRS